MKIKDIIRTLVTAGEDFSDHSTGKEDGNAPLHPFSDCAFCDAWRGALWLLSPEAPNLMEFDQGESVWIEGGIPGRVMATDVTVRVEVQNGEHGPWAVGSFSPLALTPREVPKLFRDRDGDLWLTVGAKTLALCDRDGQALTGKFECILAEDNVIQDYGPLTPGDKP